MCGRTGVQTCALPIGGGGRDGGREGETVREINRERRRRRELVREREREREGHIVMWLVSASRTDG